jgi:quaternary ammonium compound-resistance protein SugE
MKWLILIGAGIFEIGWAVGLKHTHGFSRLWPSVGTIAAMVVSLGLLGVAMKWFPLGTAYAIWVGVGVVGTTLFGILLSGESASAAKLASVALIIAGVAGLKLAGET